MDLVLSLVSFPKARGSTNVEGSHYDGILKVEALIGLTWELKRYFEYENVQEPHYIWFSMENLKGHDALWWDVLFKDR